MTDETKTDPGKEELYLFMSASQSMRMCTPEGIPITFSDFRHITNVYSVIDYLNSEIKRGNRAIYIDKDQPTILSEERDPMVAMRNRYFREFEAERVAKEAKAASDLPAMGSTKEIAPNVTEGLQRSIATAEVSVPKTVVAPQVNKVVTAGSNAGMLGSGIAPAADSNSK